jgi:hypothetical protein
MLLKCHCRAEAPRVLDGRSNSSTALPEKVPSVRRDRHEARILGLLKLLSEGGRPSIHELAARYKVRREMIY